MTRLRAVTGGVTGLLFAAVLLGCQPVPGEQVGDARLVADQEAYPGEAGPILGDVARTDEDAAGLWDVVGLEGRPPPLEAEALVVVSGGQPDDCPWRLDDVIVDDEVVRFVLAPVGSLARVFGSGRCAGGWQPRTYAVVLPADDLVGEPQIELEVPWEYPVEPVVAPFAERPDPGLWASRDLTADDLGAAFGCYDTVVAAVTPDRALLLEVGWRDEDGGVRDVAGGFTIRGELPLEHASAHVVTGNYVGSDLCSDVDIKGRPLIAERWTAVSGHLEIDVRIEEGPRFDRPIATVTLRDVVLVSNEPGAGQWYVEELELRDTDVGGVSG